jgi:DNA invertase Pin-like site-specific DNA recombinase
MRMSSKVAIYLRAATAEQLTMSDPIDQLETAQIASTGKRAVIYIRVKIPEERPIQYGNVQHNTCKDFCDRHHMQIVGTFVETTNATNLDNRPKLDEMRQMVCNGYVDAVIVYDLSRLARSQDDLLTLVQEAEEHGVGIYSVFELVPTDTITPLRAEAMVRERERAAMLLAMIDQAMHQQDNSIETSGRISPPFGYTVNGSGGIELDPEASPYVQRFL